SFNIGYGYDANGNRSQQTGTAGTTDYTTSPTSNRLDSLTDGVTTQGFSYDANGSLTADGSHTYGYDKTGRLSSVDGSTAYAYNGLGQRVSKTASGTGTVYAYDEAGHLVGEYDAATGNPIQETVWMGDTPIAVVKGSGTYYVHADHLNTPRQINDQAGDPVWVWDTITFGNSTPDEDPLATGTPFVYNLRFPGQYYDSETGLHQNYFRDYHPSLGRYIQSDPIGLAGGINTYAYAGSSPGNYIDPLGLQTATAAAAAASAAESSGMSTTVKNIVRRAMAVSPYSIAAACLLYTPSLDAPECEMPDSPSYGKCWMMNEAGESDEADVAGEEGCIYCVKGDKTGSGKDYVGSTDNLGNRQRDKSDGRDREGAEVVDTYPKGDRDTRRAKEQQAINDRGGVNNLDNKRNEVAPKHWPSKGITPP
ncbi:hypothetical protein C3942_20955, partial [Solimonas fluminis]